MQRLGHSRGSAFPVHLFVFVTWRSRVSSVFHSHVFSSSPRGPRVQTRSCGTLLAGLRTSRLLVSPITLGHLTKPTRTPHSRTPFVWSTNWLREHQGRCGRAGASPKMSSGRTQGRNLDPTCPTSLQAVGRHHLDTMGQRIPKVCASHEHAESKRC